MGDERFVWGVGLGEGERVEGKGMGVKVEVLERGCIGGKALKDEFFFFFH